MQSDALLCIGKHSFMYHDTCDHDKGQKSAISGRRLHWIFFDISPVDFPVSPVRFLWNSVRKSPQKCGENCPISGGETRVESCQSLAVMVFFGPECSNFSAKFEMANRGCTRRGSYSVKGRVSAF